MSMKVQPESVVYDVLATFTDDKDNGRIYQAGKDKYPREGYTPHDDRIAYLQGSDNKLKRPVISGAVKE